MTLRVCLTWFPSLSPWDYSPVHHRGKQASPWAALNRPPSLTRFTPALPYLYCCRCCCLVAKSRPTSATPRMVACQVLCPWDFPGKNTRVGRHVFLQGIFPIQGSNPCFLLGRWILLPLSHLGGYYQYYWYRKDLHLNSCLREPRVRQLSLYFMPTESLLHMAFYTKIWYIVFIKLELPDLQSLGRWERWCVEARA